MAVASQANVPKEDNVVWRLSFPRCPLHLSTFVSRPCTSTVTCCTASPFESPPRLVVYYRHQVQVLSNSSNKGSPKHIEIWAAAFTTLRAGTPSIRTFSPLLRYRRVRLSWNFRPARSAPIQMPGPHDTSRGGTSLTDSAAKVPGGTRSQGLIADAVSQIYSTGCLFLRGAI